MTEVVSPEVQAAGGALREALAILRANEDLIAIGAYARGSNPQIDAAIALRPEIDRFLRQGLTDDPAASDSFDAALLALFSQSV